MKALVRKMIFVTFAVIALILLLKFFCAEQRNFFDLTEIEYRTDIEPLIKRFGENLDIEQCYWKADVFGGFGIGPTSYWMKGYMRIDEDNAQMLLKKYKFEEVDLTFEEGISATVTGYKDFKWMYNEQFSNEILGVSFIGCLYLDHINNLVYFDVESM